MKVEIEKKLDELFHQVMKEIIKKGKIRKPTQIFYFEPFEGSFSKEHLILSHDVVGIYVVDRHRTSHFLLMHTHKLTKEELDFIRNNRDKILPREHWWVYFMRTYPTTYFIDFDNLTFY